LCARTRPLPLWRRREQSSPRRLAGGRAGGRILWPASQPGWQPPTPLVDFLAAGPAPVFVGFGSMTPSHERLHHAIAVAVRRAGVRAVVQSGWAELGPAGDDILVVDDPPRSCLDRPTDRPTSTAPPNSPARSAPTTAPLPCSRSSRGSKAGPDSGSDAWSTRQCPSGHDLAAARGLPGHASSPGAVLEAPELMERVGVTMRCGKVHYLADTSDRALRRGVWWRSIHFGGMNSGWTSRIRTFQPESWITRWCSRHSITRLSISVRPPSNQ